MTTNIPEDETIGTETLSDTESLGLLRDEVEHGQPPEALGVAWCDMYGTAVDKKSGEQKIVKISLTSRSAVGPQAALVKLMDTIRFAKETYRLTPYLPSFQNAPAKTPQEASEQAAPTQSPNLVAKPATVAPGAVSAPSGGASENVYHCTRMEVTPLPEERATVKFFDVNPGLQYPVLSVANWPVESILKLMPNTGEWTVEKFRLADKFSVNWMVYFENSKKTNAKGTPLKDVTRVELA